MIDTMIGLKSVQRDSLFLLRSMGAGRVKTFSHLQLPKHVLSVRERVEEFAKARGK